ncbi:YigZ family protein [Amylibacter sp. SFDW26]|uniref:YigZ family protein n=1 Tax=Amylibacter sp. SFDW26 TaxID=2652722 RepID=UPI0012626998|nr:YigZ family protein [Amylibacter sp. SFDW26]KAB7613710.1 YigZ family protein [Amylibacter sp. SFDW26]
MRQIEHVLTDKGSKYAVSGGVVKSRDEAAAFIKELKRKKKFAKATHNTWAVIFSDGEQVKNDDGESGAGAIILRMLEREKLSDHIVVVTRWYGGTHLGGDRFRHVQACVREYLID